MAKRLIGGGLSKAQRAQKELDLVHGMRFLLENRGAGLYSQDTAASELYAFMHIFHPMQAPRSVAEARQLVRERSRK